MMKKILSVIFILVFVSLAYGSEKYVHHDLKVTIEPGKKFIKVKDTILLPTALEKKEIHFLLHGNLEIVSKPEHVRIKKKRGKLKTKFFGINTAEFEIKKEIPVNHFAVKGFKKSKQKET